MHKTVIKAIRPIKRVRVIANTISANALPELSTMETFESVIKSNPALNQLWKEVKQQISEDSELSHQEGFALGKIEGLNEGRNEVAETAQSLETAIVKLTTETDKFFHDSEKMLVMLALKAAEKVIQKNVEADESLVENLITHALRWVKSREKVIIHVNPIDYEKLKDRKDADNSPDAALRFVPAASVDRGGCILETEWGYVDAQISTQIEELYTKLINGETE